VLREHAALRWSGRARGVDETCEIRWSDPTSAGAASGRRPQGLPIFGRYADFDAIRRPDHDDGPELGQALPAGRVAAHLGHPSGQAGLGDDHPGAAVGEDVTQELPLVRRVDGDLDRTELERGEEADDLLGRILQQGRDPVAPPDAQPGQAVRGSRPGPSPGR
jgi:hypothetical protein